MNTILIIDDEKNVISSFKKIMSHEGYGVLMAQNAEEGLRMVRENALDLLIMDIRMPGLSGLEAFSKFKDIDPKLPIIIMTAYGTTESAIEAMRLGAYDYITKPLDIPQMKRLIEKAIKVGRLMKTEVTFEPKEEFRGERLIGSSFKMQQIYKIIGQVAPSDVNVLLRGESGTGKELIARAIYSYSNRKYKPFMVINSAAIPDTLLESELFGFERGAFTDARERRIGRLEGCDGGTIFLDEIGDMSLPMQAKLLRVLEDRTFERLGGNKTIKVDVRLITATNRDLEGLIGEGKFRGDLYYRLNVVSIHIASLCERREDIPQLVNFFLQKYSKELKRGAINISPEALKILQEYTWPGNVRELENVIKKALLFCKGNVIQPEHIQITEIAIHEGKDSISKLRDLFGQMVRQGLRGEVTSLYKVVIDEVGKALLIEAIKQTEGNQSLTAKLLGISRPTLKDKIEKLGLKKSVVLEDE